MEKTSIARRLVICVDGTWFTPDGSGGSPSWDKPLTTVYNIFASVKVGTVIDQSGRLWQQDKKYEPGLGALAQTGAIAKLNAGAWGSGFEDLIKKIYHWACELNEQDEVWLYGFSRGAYVVRSVAGLLHYMRKLISAGTPNFEQDYKQALEVYQGIKRQGRLGKGEMNLHFKAKTAPAPIIKFVGIFDTVKALRDHDRYDISLNISIRHMRHALALNEDRKKFAPEFLEPDDETLRQTYRAGQTFVQAWFAGAHIDLGGSAAQGGLSLYSLQWMLIESKKLGLQLEFHGNAAHVYQIDNPLNVVFPRARNEGLGEPMWSCKTANGMEVFMQDLRKVHTLKSEYLSRYTIKVNRDRGSFWHRHQRSTFVQTTPRQIQPSDDDYPNWFLRGYCSDLPIGTIIHPSVYCLIDSDINVIMDSHQGPLVQHLSEWTSRMLGEMELHFDGVAKCIPNPGFWNSNNDELPEADLPALRVLVCGYAGVGKSTLVSKVFGVDFGTVSARKRGRHNVRDEIRFRGRDDLILHDSEGFEGGDATQLDTVNSFVQERVEQDDPHQQLHVIWFCVDVGDSRVVQTATESLFKAMSNCRRKVPIVVVATKKDKLIKEHIGDLLGSESNISLEEARQLAEERLQQTTTAIEFDILSIQNDAGAACGRFDALVCISKDDPVSIAELTKISSEVFHDERTRFMYVRAQMAQPDLKIRMATFEVMRRYKHAVRSAASTAALPSAPTATRQGSQHDICKRIINCFGVKQLESKEALAIMKSNIHDGLAEGLSMFWAETLAVGGIVSVKFVFTAPIFALTCPVGALISAQATAYLFLCTACDLILIMARTFQSASLHNRAQPIVADVGIAARAFNDYAPQVHRRIRDMVPRSNAFKTFQYHKIQSQFEAVIHEYWRQMAKDHTNEMVAAQQREQQQQQTLASPTLLSPQSSATSTASSFDYKRESAMSMPPRHTPSPNPPVTAKKSRSIWRWPRSSSSAPSVTTSGGNSPS